LIYKYLFYIAKDVYRIQKEALMAHVITLRVEDELKRRIDKAAQDEDRTVSSWIRHIVKQALREVEQEGREEQQ